jgi:hypothetical protein
MRSRLHEALRKSVVIAAVTQTPITGHPPQYESISAGILGAQGRSAVMEQALKI